MRDFSDRRRAVTGEQCYRPIIRALRSQTDASLAIAPIRLID